MKLKRHGILAAVAAATLALAACGSDNTSKDASGDASSAAKPAIDCKTGKLTAQGSTAQKNAMDVWVKEYSQSCTGAEINYQGTGSGAGITAFTGNTADFAGSDSALKAGDEQTKADARCTGGKAINLPMVIGPIAVAYNLDGVKDLQLKPDTLAKIFAGTIKTWDDAAIKADNPNATLPSSPITAVHRSDSSGTTENFTKYLKATAPTDWTTDASKDWKAAGGQGAAKSDGVAGAVKQTAGAIGYVEYSFVQTNNLAAAKIYNGAGEYVALDDKSAGKAVAGAQVVGTGDDLSLKIDYTTKESGAYPIVLVTYEIVCSKGNPADTVELLKSFLGFVASKDGQAKLSQYGYAPLPDTLQTKVAASISSMA
ncbi:phosphate ABC transporter substrate-binding protein PstS [Planosporangium sp. 12N6]|uniref:phosphate ABC transporter substrate-binding protein PstS n=1 Tax=Planosporangium spinosum TaxID=3402278 RepID=UPI003CF61967